MSAIVDVQSVTKVYEGGFEALKNTNLQIEEGEILALLGPNGAGKTTLMRAALGLLPHEGHASLAQMPARDRARAAAWMPQAREIAWPVDVATLIALGRIPHLPNGARLSPEDRAAIDRAVERMGLAPYLGRTATQLSGGEQARVLIARALAQDTPLLLADEPTGNLDDRATRGIMDLFWDINAKGMAVLMATHDLELTRRHPHARLFELDQFSVGFDQATDLRARTVHQ